MALRLSGSDVFVQLRIKLVVVTIFLSNSLYEWLQSGGAPQSANDIFSMFFGGGRRQKQTGPKKGEDVVHQISVRYNCIDRSKHTYI